jgi:hypothetical protein
MSNFMGPMAPPPAAPGQPPQLDFQTDPNQRQRFKQFMRQRMQPPMPQMPAPMPMAPAPQPMPTVPAGSYILPDMDIFSPQQFYDGGIVGGLNSLGEMSGQMVEALNTVVYGGDPMGGGASNGGFGGGNTPPPLPPIQSPAPLNNFGGSFSNSLFGSLMPYGNVPTARDSGPMSGGTPMQLPGPRIPTFAEPPRGMEGQPGELGFTENMTDPFEFYLGGSKYFDESTGLYTGPERLGPEYKFADGGSVSDALADALSNDIGDYAADDTMTDLAQTSYNDFDPGGNESYDAASMDQFRNQQRSDISDIIGQQIQSSITANQQMGTPAPVPQSRIEQMQFENLQNVPTTEPVFSMPSLNLGGKSTSFDLLGNPLTIGFEDGGSVPPRETDIRGMHHELSYITPDEADILMALGGTGEAGPMGIPSYRPGGDDVGSENAGSGDHSGGPGSASGANSSSDSDSDNNNDGGWDPSDYVGYTEEDEQQQTKDMQDYEENVFGGDSPDGYSVQDILNDNMYSGMGTLRTGPIQKTFTDEELGLELDIPDIMDDVITGPVDFSDEDAQGFISTGAIESSSKTSGPKTNNNLLGSDDLLSLEDYNKMLDHQRNLGLSPYKTPENVGYDETGMPKGLETVVSPDGQLVTKNLAGLTEEQMKNRPLSLKIAQDIMGSDPYAYEVDPVTNEVIGQIGTPGMGLLGQGINAIQNMILGPPETFEDLLSRGAYTGMNSPDSSGGNDGGDNVLLPISPEEVAPESTNPNQIGGISTPGSPIAAGPVLVPSTRTSTPFSGQMPVGYGTPQTGQINPYALAEMQRYEQMLARLNQPRSPIGLADGGSVLDAAAGRFLESLTTA